MACLNKKWLTAPVISAIITCAGQSVLGVENRIYSESLWWSSWPAVPWEAQTPLKVFQRKHRKVGHEDVRLLVLLLVLLQKLLQNISGSCSREKVVKVKALLCLPVMDQSVSLCFSWYFNPFNISRLWYIGRMSVRMFKGGRTKRVKCKRIICWTSLINKFLAGTR